MSLENKSVKSTNETVNIYLTFVRSIDTFTITNQPNNWHKKLNKMKANFKSNLIVLILLLANQFCKAQSSQPIWTADINALPDTIAHITPVKTLSDAAGNIYVLSNFIDNNVSGANAPKIYLRKYDYNGNVLWTYIDAISLPRAYDMAIDNAGNCYVVGSLTPQSSNQPFIKKVSTNGTLAWQQNGNSAFNYDWYSQVIFKNNMLYMAGWQGIAKYNTSGVEQWAKIQSSQKIAVDNLDRVVFTGYGTGRLNTNGTLNFIDSMASGSRLAVDYTNNIYVILSNFPNYTLVKLDSTGTQQWTFNQFPEAPPFGDIAFEILVDASQNLWAVGLNDTIFKFTPSGNVIWKKPMHNLDNYLISTSMSNNALYVLGSTPGFGSYNVTVSLFNLNGDESWSIYYDGIINGQEFGQDLIVDGYGLYILENLEQDTRLIKYAYPNFSTPVNFSAICVDSVWYDAANPNIIHVKIFNGSIANPNYPSVQIVSPTGDTISNKHNLVDFFAQIYNTYQTYTDTILITGITNFSNYTFLFSDGFGDTTVAINWCMPTSIESNNLVAINLYPNPANNTIYVDGLDETKAYTISIFNSIGSEVVLSQTLPKSNSSIDISNLKTGMYFVRIFDGKNYLSLKFLKE